jgi:outer membrane lipoprotein carrier protein
MIQRRRWLASALLAPVALAAPPLVQGSTEPLLGFARRVQRLTGRFSQVTETTQGRVGAPQIGTFAMQRPGRFRWEVQQPAPLLLVSDGQELVQYDEDLQQAIVRPLGQALAESPAALLFGTADLERIYRLEALPAQGDTLWFSAEPRTEGGGFRRMEIGLQAGLPVALILLDGFGQTTRIRFDELRQPASLPAGLFRFEPPAGVQVLR